jgi:WD40 repeat protein
MKSFCLTMAVLLVMCSVPLTADEPAPDFATRVAPLFTKYCAGCHNPNDHEGKLSLDSFANLQKGGEHGAAIVPGQADSSRLIRVLTGAAEPKMPPEGEKAPTAEEIALLKAWINAGAKGPAGAEIDRKILVTPKVPAAANSAQRIASLAYSPDGKLQAIGRYGFVELRAVDNGATIRLLSDLPAKVNAVHFSNDGQQVITASGVSGAFGIATLWNVGDGKKIRDFEGHLDTLYDAELSPDGKLLATCSYDRKVIVWSAESGDKVRTLDGHNDAVYDVAFSPDGKVLASASGDKTVKLWNLATGERLDTLSQPQGEQYVTTFSPDGNFVLAGGADNRIRVWRFVSREKPQINPLVYARFAHEGAIVGLAFSPDAKQLVSVAEDRTVKRWDTRSYAELELFEKQPDQIVDVAIGQGANTITVARCDGSLASYPLGAVPESQHASGAKEVATTAIASSGPMNTVNEQEPNDGISEAMQVSAPATITGVVDAVREGQKQDVDVFRFAAKAGQEWVIEVNAARQKSPVDSRVEVLDAQGRSIPRVLLQAVRDAYFTFRGKDSDTSDDFRVFNWEEMEINELLYSNGEVVKLWHYPRGPDSGFIVYPGRGKRRTVFDTTPLAHALGEPCYIVQPSPPGTSLIPNGLPIFTVYYENDDDAWRQWGSDSRLHFIAPADGDYLVRMTDARGLEGDQFKYTLSVRPRHADFAAKLDGANPTINAGGGKEFSINLERLDGFEGEVQIDVEGLPPGFHASTPIRVQPEQTLALGVLNAVPDAPQPTPEQAKGTKVFASATINGQVVKKEINNFGEIKLGAKAKVLARLLPSNAAATGDVPGMIPWQKPVELVITPGQTITAKVRIERNDFKERVQFGGFDSGRNLPHGVFVDNIGLNGLMIVEGQTEREFFITAAKWVPDQTRMFHLQSEVDGKQTSWPVILHVRRETKVAVKSGG